MKGKTLLSLAIASLMALVLIPALPVSASPTTLWIDPALVEDVPVCNNFSVDLRVTDVVGMWSWKVKLSWNPSVLSVVSVTEGPFLSGQAAPTLFTVTPWNPALGYIPEISCVSLAVPAKTASGSGVLATITFHVDGIGESDILITETRIVGAPPDKPDITHDAVGGHFSLPPPPPTSPKAKFTPAHCTMVYVCDWITLDGRASTDGWDTLPDPGHLCPIEEYRWDIDFLNGTVITLYGDYIPDAFHCDRPGDVEITLTVWAPDPIPPTHPDYVPVDSATHTIHQVTRPVGVVIDVYTEKGGQGLGYNWDVSPPEQWPYPTAWSDAFAPQEEVTVYAKVTYNDDPVQNKPVAFEVKDETGTAVLYRTAFTNSEGIATIDFRLIWECTKVFGAKFEVWEIFASVSVSEIEALDVCKFRYGWLVQIDEIIAPSSATKCTLVPIVIDLNNICYTDKTVFVTVVIYDDCGVPIGFATLPDWTVFANDGLTPEFIIHIPKWAYLGTGMIYANVYTGPPQLGGVPMCPEAEALIILQKP